MGLAVPEARRLSARMMEVFAGFLSHTDHHLGRLLDFLREQGILDNTIVIVISDNGASAEGGPGGTTNGAQFFNNAQETLEESLAVIDEISRWSEGLQPLSLGLDVRGQHAFRRWKRETYRGGYGPVHRFLAGRDQARGEVRTQYAHIIDMVPTVLDLLGVEPPMAIRGVAQSPIQGVSFAHTLDDPAAPSRHHVQYFEMLGHRAIYKDGWRAVCPWPGPSFAEAGTGFGNPISAEKLSELDATGWELYHIDQDPAENHDLAAERRDKLIELIGTWYVEAGKYDVMPVDGSGLARMMVEKPHVSLPRNQYIYRPGTQSIPNFAAPRLHNRPHSITATVEIPEGGAEGVLFCQGTAAGGYSLYVKGGKLHYVHNYVSRQMFTVSSPDPLAGRTPRAPLRVRADRSGRPAARQGRSGSAPAVRRRRAGRQRRRPVHHAVHVQPRRRQLRPQPGIAGDPGVPEPVQVHRPPREGGRGRQRGADRRPRGRAAEHMARQ